MTALDKDRSKQVTEQTALAIPLGQADFLVIANAYPSLGALYRNGFIHRRVKAYQAAGHTVEVFYLHPPVADSYDYVFDGVRVQVGNTVHLDEFLSQYSHRKYLVHFASPDMINPILRRRSTTPVIVWIHGFEAEAWHRRWFNFMTSSAAILEALKRKETHFDRQLDFMRWLYQTEELDITIVHVSEWFKDNIVEPDAGTKTQNSHIIPNIIDDRLFEYREKGTVDRLNILSIRPYASRKYANDISVRAVKILSERPYFEELSFSFYGEGALFQEITKEISGYSNVFLHNTFLSQEEIVKAHALNGVFLCPTRFDSQGVSMCEAMASGLVPISTRVASIPEFVQHSETGLLGEPESAVEIANMIERLYFNPELFKTISQNAAESVRLQCGIDATLGREMELIQS